MQVGAPTGFDAWFQEFIFYAGPIVQLTFWVVMIVAAIAAVILFKRWVDFQTGASSGAHGTDTGASASAKGNEVAIEEFVE